jgi:protocatechuate 3,4-dioxygenase beta subunit
MMAVYSIADLGRREIVLMSAVAAGFGLSGLVRAARAATQLAATPSQPPGPFYPVRAIPRTIDLTRVPGRPGRAAGQVLNVMGKVLDLAGTPVRDAQIEVWQANAQGRYTHPNDRNPAALDPNFDGFARLITDASGRYRFVTIKPGAYPAGPNLTRPAHIHFQVTGKEDRLVTQMYFAGDPHNAADPLLNSAELKELLVTRVLDATPELEPGSKLAMFDIVLING